MTKIYLVTNIDNNPNNVYIGKTIHCRKSAHKSKYGHQITYGYIDEINSLNHKDWEPLETYWIEQFRQWGFKVVNIRKKGGSGPDYQTEESKYKRSEKMKGRPKPKGFGDKISKAKKGTTYPTIKGRISPNKGNNIPHLKTRKPIIQYTKQGEYIKEWNSATEASLCLNINISMISAVARGNTKWKTAGGFKWKLKYE